MKTKPIYRIIDRTTGEILELYGNCRNLYRRCIRDFIRGHRSKMKCTFTPHQCVIDRA